MFEDTFVVVADQIAISAEAYIMQCNQKVYNPPFTVWINQRGDKWVWYPRTKEQVQRKQRSFTLSVYGYQTFEFKHVFSFYFGSRYRDTAFPYYARLETDGRAFDCKGDIAPHDAVEGGFKRTVYNALTTLANMRAAAVFPSANKEDK